MGSVKGFNHFKFSDYKLRKLLPAKGKKRSFFYDTKCPGLRLQVTSAGTKTFQFQMWDRQRNRPVTRTLGKYPGLSIAVARSEASRLLNLMIEGQDIEGEARNIRQEQTLDELFNLWLEQHARPHKKSWEEDRRRYSLYVERPLGKKRLSWFTPEKIRRWHFNITKMPKQRGSGSITPATANRALALLSTVFNQMVPEYPNPCKGVKKFREQSRDRFLSLEELKAFFDALESESTPTDLKDYILISLFTGARRSNVLGLRWNDINFFAKTWTIPASESKNAQSMTIPLVDQAIEILQRRKASASSIFVFPSKRSNSGHIEEPKRTWKTLLKRARLEDVRLHDLRRTLGSYMAITGSNTVAIAKALGHTSQQATAVYSKLNLDPVRAGMKNAVDAILAAKETADTVISLQSKKGEN